MARPSYPSDDVDKLLLRFPEGMRDEIKSAAGKSGRSMNGEIIHRLEKSLRAEKDDSPAVSPLLDPRFFEKLAEERERLERLLQTYAPLFAGKSPDEIANLIGMMVHILNDDNRRRNLNKEVSYMVPTQMESQPATSQADAPTPIPKPKGGRAKQQKR